VVQGSDLEVKQLLKSTGASEINEKEIEDE